LIEKIGLSDFVSQNPLVYVFVMVGAGFVFPPFGVGYFILFVVASSLGATAENGFRAKVD
jgi:hypothetical protein